MSSRRDFFKESGKKVESEFSKSILGYLFQDFFKKPEPPKQHQLVCVLKTGDPINSKGVALAPRITQILCFKKEAVHTRYHVLLRHQLESSGSWSLLDFKTEGEEIKHWSQSYYNFVLPPDQLNLKAMKTLWSSFLFYGKGIFEFSLDTLSVVEKPLFQGFDVVSAALGIQPENKVGLYFITSDSRLVRYTSHFAYISKNISMNLNHFDRGSFAQADFGQKKWVDSNSTNCVSEYKKMELQTIGEDVCLKYLNGDGVEHVAHLHDEGESFELVQESDRLFEFVAPLISEPFFVVDSLEKQEIFCRF